LDYALSADLSALKLGYSTPTTVATPGPQTGAGGSVKGTLTFVGDNAYLLSVPADKAGEVGAWLRDLSDGYVSLRLDGQPDFDPMRLPGPVVVADLPSKVEAAKQGLPG